MSVQTSLQAETSAVMRALNSVSDENNTDDVRQLRRCGVLLADQHKLLLRLFKLFRLQEKRIQQICSGDGEVEMSDSGDEVCLSQRSEQPTKTSLQPVNSVPVLRKKCLRACDNAAVCQAEFSSKDNQHISVTSLSDTASLQSVAKNIPDANVTDGTVCDVSGYRGGMSGTAEAVCEQLDASCSSDCDQTAACEADEDGDCSADRRQSRSPRSDRHCELSCQQTDAFYSLLATPASSSVSSPHHACTATYSPTDCNHDDTVIVGDVPLTKLMSTTVTIPYVSVAAAAAARSTLSVPSFSSLTMCDSLPASQPVCELNEPSAKKRRPPPPSPSLLSLSSGSPPLSPLLLPVIRPLCPSVSRHPIAAAARYPGTTHVNQPSHYLQQTAATSMLPNHSLPAHTTMSRPSSKVSVLSNTPRSVDLPAAASSTATTTPAVTRLPADGVSASQCSLKSVMKTSQRPYFSLRQLIADDIIHPGHNVLSVQSTVIFYRRSRYSILMSFSCRCKFFSAVSSSQLCCDASPQFTFMCLVHCQFCVIILVSTSLG